MCVCAYVRMPSLPNPRMITNTRTEAMKRVVAGRQRQRL